LLLYLDKLMTAHDYKDITETINLRNLIPFIGLDQQINLDFCAFIPKSSLGIDDFALRVTKTLILKVLSGLTLTLEMNDSILKKAI